MVVVAAVVLNCLPPGQKCVTGLQSCHCNKCRVSRHVVDVTFLFCPWEGVGGGGLLWVRLPLLMSGMWGMQGWIMCVCVCVSSVCQHITLTHPPAWSHEGIKNNNELRWWRPTKKDQGKQFLLWKKKPANIFASYCKSRIFAPVYNSVIVYWNKQSVIVWSSGHMSKTHVASRRPVFRSACICFI